jgi:hypothetical protein
MLVQEGVRFKKNKIIDFKEVKYRF